MFLSDFLQIVDNSFILSSSLLRPDHRRNSVNLCAGCLRSPRVSASSSGKRTPRVHAYFAVKAERHHLVLFLPVNQVVLVLHGDELRPVIALGDVLETLELPRVHCARSDIPSFAGLHNVMKSLHNLLHRRERVEPVDLVQVNVIEA